MAIGSGQRAALAALVAFALVCGAQSLCTVNAVPNFQKCCPGSVVGTSCGADCSGGCNGSCIRNGTSSTLVCAPCYKLGQPCCPGKIPGDICAITGCGGGGCGYQGSCVGTGTGRQLTCRKCGLVIGNACCVGNKPGSACGPYYFTGPVTGHTGFCNAKMICTACPKGKPCPPPLVG